MRIVPLLLSAAALCACVPLPEASLPRQDSTAINRAPFKPLDPGAYEQSSLHFRIRAYGADNARRISDQAEAFYRNIMEDTNLYSFMPSGLYEIQVYDSHSEYMAKTGQPEWSGGVAYGNAIYSYVGPQLYQTVAHEMTHLVFNEFMVRARPDLLWVNEGLAVYEQAKAAGDKGSPAPLFADVRDRLVAQPASMQEMLAFVPLQEKASDDPTGAKVSLWYAEAQSLVGFLIEKGGRLGFSQLLQALKDGKGFDAAIGSAYPGEWRSLAEFYLAWRKDPA